MYHESHQQGRYFSFALAQFLHYLIIIFNLYLSLTHPPRVTRLRQNASCERDLLELNYTLIQPITCPTVRRSACTTMLPDSIYQTTILQGIYHFYKAMHTVIYKMLIHTTVNTKRPSLLCCASLRKQSA